MGSNMNHRTHLPGRRTAFTLIELLVVIAIIAILVGLMVPAVQKVRTAANRMSSQNNLKQLGLALHNFESTHARFPGLRPTGTSNATSFGFSVHAQLLPFIEQEGLGKSIDLQQPLFVGQCPSPSFGLNPSAMAAAATPVKTFLCPGDNQKNLFTTNSGGGIHAGTNYVVNLGSGIGGAGTSGPNGVDSRFPSNGMFHYGSGLQVGDITDGTSNTMFMSQCLLGLDLNLNKPFSQLTQEEARRQTGSVGGRGLFTGPGGANPGYGPSPAIGPSDHMAVTSWRGTRGGSWIWGNATVNGFTAAQTPNAPTPDATAHGMGILTARSNFPGGVCVCFGDGSIRFVSDRIQLATWRALATRAGGEVTSND